MHLPAQSEESAKAHDQRTPARRVDTRSALFAHEQLVVDVQFHDMHLERVRAHILAEGAEIVDDTLHLHRALAYARRRHADRFHRSEPRNAEFVWLITIAPLAFL